MTAKNITIILKNEKYLNLTDEEYNYFDKKDQIKYMEIYYNKFFLTKLPISLEKLHFYKCLNYDFINILPNTLKEKCIG